MQARDRGHARQGRRSPHPGRDGDREDESTRSRIHSVENMNTTETNNALLTRPNDCDVRVGPEPADTAHPRRLPDAARVLLAVPIMFAFATAPGLLLLIPGFEEYLQHGASDGAAVATLWAMYSIAPITALVLVWLAMRYIDRRPFSDTGWGWNARSLPALGIGLAATVAMIVPVAVAVQATGVLRPMPFGTEEHPTWVVVLVALGLAFLLQGIPEELVWRGYVMQTLRTTPVVSVYISAVVFAVCHLTSSGGQQSTWERFVYLLVPFGFSLLAGALLLISGSLWAAVGVHAGFHVATLVNTVWLGVGSGPELWAAMGIVLGLAGAALLHRWSAKTS